MRSCRDAARLDVALQRAQRRFVDRMRGISPRLMPADLFAELGRAAVVAVPLDAASPSQRQLAGQLAIELLPRLDAKPVQIEVRPGLLRIRRIDPGERIRGRAARRARPLDYRDGRSTPGEPIREVRADDPTPGDDDAGRRRGDPTRFADDRGAEKQ